MWQLEILINKKGTAGQQDGLVGKNKTLLQRLTDLCKIPETYGDEEPIPVHCPPTSTHRSWQTHTCTHTLHTYKHPVSKWNLKLKNAYLLCQCSTSTKGPWFLSLHQVTKTGSDPHSSPGLSPPSLPLALLSQIGSLPYTLLPNCYPDTFFKTSQTAMLHDLRKLHHPGLVRS